MYNDVHTPSKCEETLRSWNGIGVDFDKICVFCGKCCIRIDKCVNFGRICDICDKVNFTSKLHIFYNT